MGRTKGSLNKSKQENLESKPVELKTNIEELKKEKSMEQKTVEDMTKEVSSDEDSVTRLSGVGPKTAEKLREKGYITLTDIATTRVDELAAVMQIGYAQAKVWVDDAMDKVSARIKLKTAEEQDVEKKARVVRLTTGSKELDKMLGGGVATESITGTCGEFATGKTQIGFNLIVDVLGRLRKKAVFIETEPDTFHLDRLKEMAKLQGYDNIKWSDLYICESNQIPTPKAQYLQYKVIQRALEKGEPIILIVIDSFNALFRGWSRSELLPIRSREFVEHFTLMKYLTDHYHLAWYLTFQAMQAPRPDQGLQNKMKYGQEQYVVAGGVPLHTVNQWLALDKVKINIGKATLFDSSYLPRATANFMLVARGPIDEVK